MVEHAKSQVAQKSKFKYLNYLQTSFILTRGGAHMRDQRFSKHTLIAISPGQKKKKNRPKQEFWRAIMSPNLPLNKLFWRTCSVEFEKKPSLTPLNRILKEPFSQKYAHFDP